MTQVDCDFEARLKGYALATAEILYYMPDHPALLQSFTWQTLDIAPRFPRIIAFLDYWRTNIEATIHTVQLTHAALLTPAQMRFAAGEFRLH